MKRALITGITGQDGSYLAEFLLDKGYDVSGLTRSMEQSHLANIRHIADKINLVQGDLSDCSSLENAIKQTRPNEIYNLGGDSFVPDASTKPVRVGNVTGLGVIRLLNAIKNIDKNIRFYQASTSEIFGNAKESPQNENTPFRPRNLYGVTKLYAHLATINFRKNHDMHACCGICYNHESPRRMPEFVTRKITNTAAKIYLGMEKELKLGNTESMRDWGYAPDYVRAMWLMLQQDKPNDYIIATGETHSVREFVEKAFSVLGLDWQKYVKTNKSLFRKSDTALLQGDYSKARQELGWKPQVKFNELVEIMVKKDLARLKKPKAGRSTS